MKITLVDAILERGIKRNHERTEMERRRRIPNAKKNLLPGEDFTVCPPALFQISLENKDGG
jgi:hypothetical protein